MSHIINDAIVVNYFLSGILQNSYVFQPGTSESDLEAGVKRILAKQDISLSEDEFECLMEDGAYEEPTSDSSITISHCIDDLDD